MKKHNGIKKFFLVLMILLLLAAIGIGGYICYQMYLERQKTPDDILQIEQERTQIAYEENLNYAMEAKEKSDFVVVLNPAHGGMDQGKENAYGTEKDIVLSICEQVIAANTDTSLGIFLTRDDDVSMDEDMRLAFVKEIQPDIFIDVHLNKDAVTSSYGTTVYYDTTYYNRKLTNVEFADIMEKGVVTAIEGFACGIFESENEETQIINDLNMPAVSIACGDLSNEKEGVLLTREPYQQNIAKGILEGINAAREKLDSNGAE